jgi:flagellin
MERLSSGFRINRAADDAAGLAISEKLKASLRGLSVAKRNASDGISLVQTAEGGMNEVGNILSRLRELAVQGSSDTIGNSERGFLNKEFMQLKDEIDRISYATDYNGTLLMTGERELPAGMTTNSNKQPLEIQVSKNWLKEVDGDKESPAVDVIRIDLRKMDITTDTGLGLGKAGPEGGTRVDTKEDSQTSISVLDNAIQTISGHRADLGAIQNRLSSSINSLGIQMENYAAANSRIRDTDFADETAKMTQAEIIKQAGVSVLAQANSSPQVALKLLG